MKEKPILKLYKYINSQFTLQAQIDDYQEISFEHNLYEAGNFTITINYNIPNALKFERGMFVQFGNNPYMFGEILRINDSIGEDGKGSQIRSITGKDARFLFKRRIIKNLNNEENWIMTDKGEICIRNLVKDQCGTNAESKRQLPITNTIPATADAVGKEYSVSESYTNLYDTLVTIATQSEIGWRIKFDGIMSLECYEGSDISSQVQFSTEFDSLSSGQFSDSSESYANSIYIGGKGIGAERDIYEGENSIEGSSPSGLDRYEAWDNQSEMTSESEYEAEALSMLTQYGQTVTVSGKGLVQCPYIFQEQYDIGDVITIAFSGKSAKAQILAVTEHWTWGKYSLEFSFGKPQNDLARQLQLILKQIQKASSKTTVTASVKWYMMTSDAVQDKSDVIYDTIGFTGNIGNGKNFTFYIDSEKTGSKTYTIYGKNLSGSGKLTLKSSVSETATVQMDVGNWVSEIYVDADGNVMKPAVPTKTSELENDSGFVTSSSVPTKTSELENDSGFVTSSSVPTKTSELENDSGFVSPQNVLFNDTDVPEGSGNLNTAATVHKITTYRNGFTIPYQMDNTNDGGLLRVRGTSEDNCILELGTWDDSGAGETIQFNYYPTTSKDTPTHSVSVPKKSGTIALTSDTAPDASKLGGWDYLLSAATSGSNKWVGVSAWSWSANSGYIKFTNGLIIQFFQTSYTYNNTIYFPISFDNYCLSLSMLILDSYYSAGVGININNVRNLTKSSFWAQLDGNTPKECWIAIGY